MGNSQDSPIKQNEHYCNQWPANSLNCQMIRILCLSLFRAEKKMVLICFTRYVQSPSMYAMLYFLGSALSGSSPSPCGTKPWSSFSCLDVFQLKDTWIFLINCLDPTCIVTGLSFLFSFFRFCLAVDQTRKNRIYSLIEGDVKIILSIYFVSYLY